MFHWCSDSLELISVLRIHPESLKTSCYADNFSRVLWGLEIRVSETLATITTIEARWYRQEAKLQLSENKVSKLQINHKILPHKTENICMSRHEWKNVVNLWSQHFKHSLGQRHATSLSNQLFVVQHWRVPLQLQETQQLFHFLLGVKNELLVLDR